MFFRKLPDPVIPWEAATQMFLAIDADDEINKKKQISEALALLPFTNRATLAVLVRHLLKVTQVDSLTDRSTLGIIFGPNLMSAPWMQQSNDELVAIDLPKQHLIVESLIEHAEDLIGFDLTLYKQFPINIFAEIAITKIKILLLLNIDHRPVFTLNEHFNPT